MSSEPLLKAPDSTFQQPQVTYQSTHPDPQNHHQYSHDASNFAPISAPPSSPSYDPHFSDEKFSAHPRYRDIVFLILFAIHLVFLFAIMIFGAANHPFSNLNNNNDNNDDPYFSISRTDALSIFGVSIVVAITGFLIAVLFVNIIQKFSKQLIYINLVGSVGLFLVLVIFSFVGGSIAIGVVLILCTLLVALFVFLGRNLIEFTADLLKVVAGIIQIYPATIYASYLSFIPMILVILFYSGTSILIVNLQGAAFVIVVIYLLFSFFWTTQVIKNVIRVTASGTFASWYFFSPNIPENPTIGSFKRAITTSLGSIICGSLFVAILQVLRAVTSSRNNSSNIFIVLLNCFVRLAENLLRYFNRYAFSQIAIYGKSYMEAGKSVFHLFADCGLDAVVNDNLSNGVLNLVCLFGAAVNGLVGVGLGLLWVDDYWVATGFIGFVIGMVFLILTTDVIDAGITTLFVCFADEPARLREVAPEFYSKFRDRYCEKCRLLNLYV